MAIEDEMFKQIEKKIDSIKDEGIGAGNINFEKAKEVARMLTELSTDNSDAESLVNQYMAGIKNIFK
jgi:hypothetical protein